MRPEIEPISAFRGRFQSDYKPKKPLKRNGEKSAARSPRYFPDQSNRKYLNILVYSLIQK